MKVNTITAGFGTITRDYKRHTPAAHWLASKYRAVKHVSSVLIFSAAFLYSLDAASSGEKPMSGFLEREGWAVGLTATANVSPYLGSTSNESSVIPFISWQQGLIYIGIDEIRLTLADTDLFSFSATAQPRWASDTETNDPDPINVSRDMAIEIGISTRAGYGLFYIGADSLTDVTSVHNGHSVSALVGTVYSQGKFMTDFSLGYQYQDRKLNSYLYGVQPDETGLENNVYSPTASAHPYIELLMTYQLDRNISIVGSGNAALLATEARHSPLINRDVDTDMNLSVIFKF